MTEMTREEWLKEKRRLTEVRMDTIWAPIYDDNWGATIEPSHRQMMGRFLALCPPGCLILDAACGTGKYWPLILESGRQVQAFDQSQQMLNRAHAKFPDVQIQKHGLQEMAYVNQFAGICCMDAMENIFPEDWPLVMTNFERALVQGGYLYLTVELATMEEQEASYKAAQAMGLPVVFGELAHEGGYHYYPALSRVDDWIRESRLKIVDQLDGDSYHHIVMQKPSPA